MRCKTSIVILILMFMATVAQAQVFTGATTRTGDDFFMADFTLDRVGGLEVAAAVGVDYFWEESNQDDYDLDITETYIGPIVKWHFTPEDDPLDIHVAYAPMNQYGTDDWYNILEAGATYFVTESLGIGMVYHYCADFEDDDRLMFTATWRW